MDKDTLKKLLHLMEQDENVPEKIDPKYAIHGGEGLQHIILPGDMNELDGSRELKRIIHMGNPDKKIAILIIKKHLNKVRKGIPPVSTTVDWEEVEKQLPDASGAVIAEIAKRLSQWIDQNYKLTTQLVLEAIASMQDQITLMNEPVEQEKSSAEKVLEDLGEFLKIGY